ncbi:glycosyltransferase family 2 protein [Companilactobacillus kimchiensis]|uniref:Glycosyltransferase 2-like domain-containing protein n=1 Tax=Companilactobacillus kimchiensis TaxID=993692 RepID=A0A0R2LLX6_9LACO|nr:glycosyltransferase [Companilactobacillus kimchiensis]KRO00384.1 hypothetical protein IV57_GL001488 [Companilactobacillus kimchiensis]
MKVGLFIPTYNAGNSFDNVLKDIDESIQNSGIEVKKLMIDTFSNDNTVEKAKRYGFDSYEIKKEDFTHGEVRKRAANYFNGYDYIIYMTQDVRLHLTAIGELISFISKSDHMLVAYGRQISDPAESTIFEQKARDFNYPSKSIIKSKNDIKALGVKAAFSSDAFSIYRRGLLMDVGSFPSNILYCEDEYVAAQGIIKGYEVGYCAEAVVTHSNHMNLKQQYKRYKSIGDFHKQNQWIQREFGSNESEGVKSVLSEWKYLTKNKKAYLIPYSFLIASIKYVAYKF